MLSPALRDMGLLRSGRDLNCAESILLATPEHPLVLFLDDVHRADMGSGDIEERLKMRISTI